MRKVIFLIGLLFLAGCGGSNNSGGGGGGEPLAPVGVPQEDGSIVRGRAEVQIGASQESAMMNILKTLMPYAYAATGTTTVTYTNAQSVSFTINVANLGATGFTGDILNLGSVSLATLDDNKLKVCNPGGNTKCTQGIIRVYTTGSIAGFANAADNFGAPVYVGTLNPTTAIGLNTAGAVQTQVVTIASNKNRLRINDFPSPTYSVTSDFSNAGAGNYSMNFVVEYVLAP